MIHALRRLHRLYSACGLRLLLPSSFVTRLIPQVFSFLGVALHIPFIGLLTSHDLVKSLMTEPLRSGKIRMAASADISRRSLPHGNRSEQDYPRNYDG